MSVNTDLHIAVMNQQFDNVKELLELKNIQLDRFNHHRETPLFLSLKYKYSDEFVSLLINHGCCVNLPNKKGVTPLHLAVQRRTSAMVSILIDNGANINAQDYNRGCTPLHWAVAQGRFANIQELLKWRKIISVEIKNVFGQTPLIYGLCKESGDKIISTLIDYGCDINVADHKGHTALYYAACKRSTFICQKLIERGANIDFKSKNGDTPLHAGISQGNEEYICTLLCYGASVNEMNKLRRTPFHNALQPYAESIAQDLLDYIVDFNIKDIYGYTYLHIALTFNLPIAIDLLKKSNINELCNGKHSLYLACLFHSSYSVLKCIWLKTDFNLFFSSLKHEAFLDKFCKHSKLTNMDFLSFLYIMLDSHYIEDLLYQREQFENNDSLIHIILMQRNLTLDERLEMLTVLLSYGVNVHFNDIRLLYELYGFDESMELLLLNGCYINYSAEDLRYYNLIVNQIYFNNIDLCTENWSQSNERKHKCIKKLKGSIDKSQTMCYCRLYRATFSFEDDSILIHQGISSQGEICSLLEISRNLIRQIVYKNCNSSYSFNIYQVMAKLPVPILIRDILFLKKAIYE